MPGLSRATDNATARLVEAGRGRLSRNAPHKYSRKSWQLSREETDPVQVCKQRAETERYLLYGKEKEKSETWMSLWGFQSES